MMIRSILGLVATLFFATPLYAECPEGRWPRDQFTGPGGGLYSGPGGGLYTGPGGGAYTGPGGGLYAGPGGGLFAGPGGGLFRGPGGGLYKGPGGGLYAGPGGGLHPGPGGGMYAGPEQYCGNTPPWVVLIEHLERDGFAEDAVLIKSKLPKNSASASTP